MTTPRLTPTPSCITIKLISNNKNNRVWYMAASKKKASKKSTKIVNPQDDPAVMWMVVVFTLLSLTFAYLSYLYYT